MSRSSSSELYRNTQFGTVVFSAMAASLAVTLALGFLAGWPAPLVVVLPILAALLVAFYSLTTVVTPRSLQVAFGPGWISKTIPLAEIQSATPGRTNFLWGWGIRYWPGRGWMWNVTGFDVVVLTMMDGNEFRVGTDDPEGLSKTLGKALVAAG